jgi:hypothetical protein
MSALDFGGDKYEQLVKLMGGQPNYLISNGI